MSRRLPLLAALMVELVAILILQWKVLEVGHGTGGSMAPTIPNGSWYLVDLLDRDVSNGDIVVAAIDHDGDGTVEAVVKRVLAVGGQTISCCDPSGAVLRDGRPLTEPYVREDGPHTHEPFCAVRFGPCPVGAEPVHVPAHHVWLMGDHRSTSADSRFMDRSQAAVPVSALQGIVHGPYGVVGTYLRLIAVTGLAGAPASAAAFVILFRLLRPITTQVPLPSV